MERIADRVLDAVEAFFEFQYKFSESLPARRARLRVLALQLLFAVRRRAVRATTPAPSRRNSLTLETPQ
jgi:hypothetical protein